MRQHSKRIPLEEVLKEDSSYPRVHLKRRLLADGYLKNECSICRQIPEWKCKPLSLHLDHINGVNNDNRIENLRILCPHCHSQQKTTCKNKKANKIKHFNYCGCNKVIGYKAKLCENCSHKKRRKFEVSKLELEDLILHNSFVKIGKMFGVSDNAIRKRAKKLGLI